MRKLFKLLALLVLLAIGPEWGYNAEQGTEALKLRELTVTPNPSTHTAEFRVDGQGVHSVRLEVFNLTGTRIFDSGEIEGKAFQWNLQNQKGQVVANGVYLYIVTVRGFNGEVIRSRVQKLVVLR